jgi:hypothetical protein
MFCSQCGSRQESQARFCTVCGRSLAAPTMGAREAPALTPSPPPESADSGARPSGPPSAGEVAAFAALYEQHALEIHDFLLRTLPRKGRPRSRFGLRRLLAPARRTPA